MAYYKKRNYSKATRSGYAKGRAAKIDYKTGNPFRWCACKEVKDGWKKGIVYLAGQAYKIEIPPKTIQLDSGEPALMVKITKYEKRNFKTM